jgi:hypothetical protein
VPHKQLESEFSLLTPPPSATRSCVLHYFDAHRLHSEDTSTTALISCIASSQWFRLTRCFGDHFVIRYDRSGKKLVYPLLVAFSPRLRTKASDHAYWAALHQQLTAPPSQPPPPPAQTTAFVLVFSVRLCVYTPPRPRSQQTRVPALPSSAVWFAISRAAS